MSYARDITFYPLFQTGKKMLTIHSPYSPSVQTVLLTWKGGCIDELEDADMEGVELEGFMD